MSEKVMRYSEAIRLGATMKPQGFKVLISDKETCAHGADFVEQLEPLEVEEVVVTCESPHEAATVVNA